MSHLTALEPRRLFAAGTVVSLVDAADNRIALTARLSHTGTLQINGTPRRDRITITRSSKTGSITLESKSGLFLNLDGGYGVAGDGGFDPALVKRIKVNGGKGDDVLVNQITGTYVPITLNGEAGDDDLSTLGRGDVLIGGSGNDRLRSLVPFYQVNFINPVGTVNDSRTIVTTTGSDGSVVGRSLNGNASFSVVISATGNRLEGGIGDDTFESPGGEDTVIGGTGSDHFTAGYAGVDVYGVSELPTVTGGDDASRIRSRVAITGVIDVTTKVNRSGVEVLKSSLAELA